MINAGDMATAFLTSSVALLGLSALILVTLRLSNFSDIKERVSRQDYNRMYDWTWWSFMAGVLSIGFTLAFFIWAYLYLLQIAGSFTAIQVGTLAFAVLRTLWPPKIFNKSQRNIWCSTIKHNKLLKKKKKRQQLKLSRTEKEQGRMRYG